MEAQFTGGGGGGGGDDDDDFNYTGGSGGMGGPDGEYDSPSDRADRRESYRDREEREEDDEDDDDGGGWSVGIPTTDYELTTDRDEANVVSAPTTESVDESDDDHGLFGTGVGPDVGVSDDPTSMEDAGYDVEISDDPTSTEGSGGVRNVLSLMDDATVSATDPVLDPAQEGTRSGLQYLTGADDDEELAEQFQAVDEGVTEQVDNLVEGTTFDDGHLGTLTEATRTGTDMFITEGARVGVGTMTGVDTQEGDTDFEVGLAEAADVALTAGTLGGGRLAAGAARQADDGGGLLSRFTRESDDAGQGTTRQADEGTPATSQADEADTYSSADDPLSLQAGQGTRQADEATQGTRQADEVEDGARWQNNVDDAGQGTARQGDDSDELLALPGRTADEAGPGARQADNAGQGTARQADDVEDGARWRNNVDDAGQGAARQGDDAGQGAARQGDNAGQGAARQGDNAGQGAARQGDNATPSMGERIRNAMPNPSRRQALFAGGAGAAIVGGGYAMNQMDPDDAPDEITTEDGYRMVWAQTFEPTEEYPNGGELYAVTENAQNIGYWVLLGVQGRNLILLDENGEPREAKIEVDQFREMQGGQQGGGE